MSRYISISIVFGLLLITSCKEKKTEPLPEQEKETTTDQPPKKVLSPHTSAMATIGNAHIHIDYSSPGVRDRMIFGGLLAYDQVWQAGAHMATWIETDTDLEIDGKELKAGKYGFFTIPSKEEWTIILNSNWNQHGKDEYDEKDDVIRFKVTPIIADSLKEHLEYNIKKISDTQGEITLAWEKVKVVIPFKVK
ncbi:DUF2911 domain-containing protein [Allomuricauda sp. ARW1Y1]|jgi:hypothetical protein|uniref:DUF2911 domain-containing protein n=1 Tax=Allomuricauda sp. ARW1Y1 TaxID=2663843 RepID=UPI0015CBEB8C|nr:MULTISPECIES: DUF2911 domain-containing protein [unclassified Allomuricauda]MBO6829371.1 DUF2911 domain-containing protein [Allomuricauda sp.]NYJ28177.1 hypothetical protein [Muricauda sp. ARW1Y1]